MKKSQQMSESLPLAAILTLSGGFMDAYSYIGRGHVFANAQTGNILLFGVSLSTGDFSSSVRFLFPVLAFACGIAAAEIVKYNYRSGKRVHWRQITVLTEAIILFAVSFLPQERNLLANSLTSFACGAQVQSFRKINGIGAATTMCIGNLRAATHAFVDFRFTGTRSDFERGVLYLGVIVMFVAGAVIGNLCVGLWRERAILVSSGLMLAGFSLMLFNREE